MTAKSKGSNPQRKKFRNSLRSSNITDYYNDGYDGAQGICGSLGSRRTSKCIVKFYLILSALGGFVASIGIIAITAVNNVETIEEFSEIINCCIIIKAICIAPFITYEYYMIIFEHVFVDTSHYMSSMTGVAFINNISPSAQLSLNANRSSIPKTILKEK